MFILLFSGMIAVVELCILGLHESHRNCQAPSRTGNRQQQDHHHLLGNADLPITTPFSSPAKVSPRETLDRLGLLQNTAGSRLPFDDDGRLM